MSTRVSSIFAGAVRRVRAFRLRQMGVSMNGRCWIRDIEIPRNHGDIHLDDGVALDRGVCLLCTGLPNAGPRISIGPGTYINRYTILDASERINIGARCMIGPFCYITDHDHGTELGIPIHEQALEAATVQIEDGVWLGARVTVLKGVRIMEGAVVGAGTVVTRDVGPNTIVVGVPGKQVGVRSSS